MKAFGSIEEIQKADVESLCKVDSITEKVAMQIFNFFHGKEEV